MIFSGHGDARRRMLHLIRQYMNSLISGDSQDCLRRHDFSDRTGPRSSKANTTRNRHPYGVTFRDHRHHLNRSAGRCNRRRPHRTNRPGTATIRALERYGDQILIWSRFVYPTRTPTFTGTDYAHIPVLVDLNLRSPKLSTRHPPSCHPSTLSLPKTLLPFLLLTLSTSPCSSSQRPDRDALLLSRSILDSLTQRIEYSRLPHRPNDRSNSLTGPHGTNLSRYRRDVLRIDTPCAAIPPSLLARSVVIPTCWGRHRHTSIDVHYGRDRSTVNTPRERRDSISFTPSNNLDFCLLPRTEVARFIDLTVISPSFLISSRSTPPPHNSLNRHPKSKASRIGNVLPARGLTSPPDHCGGTPVIWRIRTSSTRIAVLDMVRSSPPPHPAASPDPTRAGRHAGSHSPTGTARPRRRIAPAGPSRRGLSLRLARHSHSMVPGGLLVQSSTTRLTSGTELVIRLEMRARTS